MHVRTLELAYGHGSLHIDIPEDNLMGVIEPREAVSEGSEQAIVLEALGNPIGMGRLRDLARPGQRVAIVTSDLTRPCPSAKLLPPLLDELNAGGIPDSDLTIIIALGLHRAMTEAELETAVGSEVYRRVRVLNHDPNDTVSLGRTSAGTPVAFFRPLVEADLRVCLGNLEFHYFAGYSGGAKAILPGCASAATVAANHAMMVRPDAVTGQIAPNPVRADIEEGADLLGIDFILNVIVDSQKQVTAAFAGDVTAAHRAGCELVARRGKAPIAKLADVVVVSAGGYPKDVNLYQAQKALDNARCAVRQRGAVVLLAECPEGLGNRSFEDWMRASSCPDDLLARIQREFVLGGHKAAAIAAVEKRASVFMVSSLPRETVECCHMAPCTDANSALQAALDAVGAPADIIVLPQGGSVLPQPSEGCD